MSLDLSFNHIEKIEGLESLKKLEELNLSNNRISVLENMDSLENLVSFNIANNSLKQLDEVRQDCCWVMNACLGYFLLLGQPNSMSTAFKGNVSREIEELVYT